MARGIRRLAIFENPDDYYIFNKILKKIMSEKPFTLHCYCQMTNHFHMLLTSEDYEIGEIMQVLLSDYAKFFNRKYGYSGHLFDSRFTSKIVENPQYFLEVSRYIHLNPVKAGIVTKAEDYSYSSYNTYINGKKDPMITTNKVFSMLEGDEKEKIYRNFVEGDGPHLELEDEISKDMKENKLWLPDD